MHTPWKESYDQPRGHIKKQRRYFAIKGPSSQGYGFSSSHVWMWDLDYKESWVSKNWCFWIVVLEKTLESPLDYKEVQPVHPKGDQNWNAFKADSENVSFEGLFLPLLGARFQFQVSSLNILFGAADCPSSVLFFLYIASLDESICALVYCLSSLSTLWTSGGQDSQVSLPSREGYDSRLF